MKFYDESGKSYNEELKQTIPSRKVRRRLNDISTSINELIDDEQRLANQEIEKLSQKYASKYRYKDEAEIANDNRTVLERGSAKDMLVTNEVVSATKPAREKLIAFAEETRFREKVESFIAITKVDEIKNDFVKGLFSDSKSELWDLQDMEEIEKILSKFRLRLNS